MPLPTPFHPRTSEFCESLRFKTWAGYFAVSSYQSHHDPEYFAFRNAAGLLDISPLFKYEISGVDSAAFLSRVATRDLGSLRVGRVSYACFCDSAGKVIDDGTIARIDDELFRVTTFYNIVSLLLAQKAKDENITPMQATDEERAGI